MIPIRDNNPSHSTPYLTVTLIAINVVVFLLAQFQGDEARKLLFTLKYAYVPAELTADRSEFPQKMIEAKVNLIEQSPAVDVRTRRPLVRPDGTPVTIGELPRLRDHVVASEAPKIRAETEAAAALPAWINIFTCMFLHGGWMHLIGNMLFLWIFGDNIEDRLGRVLFLLFYLGTGVLGNLAHTVFDSGFVPLIGASGAVSGIMGGYLVLFPRARLHAIMLFGWYPVTLDVPAYIYMIFYMVAQNLFPAFFAAGMGGVAHWAHIGGFLSGMLCIHLLPKRKPIAPPRRPPEYDEDADFII